MTKDISRQLYELLLPKELTAYFELVEIRNQSDKVLLVLDELNNAPAGYKKEELESKGFLPSLKLQDFPIRDQQVYLEIRRRKWLHKPSGKNITTDWKLAAKGTSYTQEFGAFLKALVGYSTSKRKWGR